MFSNLETLFLYNFLLFLSVFFCYLYNRKHCKLFIFIPYILIFLFSTFRYDIGYDYENYARSVLQISKFLKYLDIPTVVIIMGKEPIMVCLISFFGQIEHLFVVIFSIYSLAFTYFIYKTFDTYKIHTLGIFLLFTLTVLFQYWDWMRQGVSLSIFLFALKYIEAKKLKKYILYILFAALWHFSAIILLFAYPIARIKISNRGNKFLYILVVVFILAELQVFSFLYGIIIEYVPYYNEIYTDSDYSTVEEFKFHSLPFIIYSLWYMIIVHRAVNNNTPYAVLLFVGVILFMISGGSLLIDRIAWYFTGIQLIIVPMYYRLNGLSLSKLFICLFIFYHFMYFNRQIINGGLRGSSQYITVFSENYEHGIFIKR